MHGFCHFEIPTTDSSKSGDFYAKLFGWKLDASTPDYTMFTTPDDEGGGFTTMSKPTNNGVIMYIEVEDIDAKLREIEAAGGKKVKPKAGISPEFGFYALFTDPSGNIMGLWGRT
jgi:predicted enzyme related to lactoylglutathione lyase